MAASSGTEDVLVEQLLESPDDPAPYLVYGDWLQAHGDPRGQLIAAQAAPASADLAVVEARLLEEHRVALLGAAAELEPPPAIEWSFGFWRALRLGGFGWNAITSAQVEAVLAAPSACVLRELAIDAALEPAILEVCARKHRTLEALDVSLRNHRIDDRGLAALAPCTRLEQLALFSCEDVTAAGLAPLGKLSSLRAIDLRNHALAESGVDHLRGLPLTEVRFNVVAPGFGCRGMAALAEMPLQTLALDGDPLDDAAIAPLAGHGSLANVELAGATLGPRGMAALAAMPSLRRLYLPSSVVGDASVRQLEPRAATLRALFLGHCEALTDGCCESLARLRELVYLDLSATRITGDGLRMLAPLSRLEHLDLGFLDLSDADVGALAALPQLTALSVVYSRRLTDAAIDVVAGLPALEQLDLGGTGITHAAIDRLRQLPNLHRLGLLDCDDDVVEYARAFDNWYVTTSDSLDLGFGERA